MKHSYIKKKINLGSVAVYVLAILLVTAGYWGYISKESQTLETVSVSQNEQENNKDEHLGDATLVSNNELMKEESNNEESISQETNSQLEIDKESTELKKDEDEYFQESKLSRDTMYSQTLETYQNMLNNPNVSEEQKSVITQEITKLNNEKKGIMICENLISTKGFENCVIFVNMDSISVIIKSKELSTDEIAQIQNIVSREMGAEITNIHIMTK